MSIKGGYRIQMVAWIPILFIYLKSVINCVGFFFVLFFCIFCFDWVFWIHLAYVYIVREQQHSELIW